MIIYKVKISPEDKLLPLEEKDCVKKFGEPTSTDHLADYCVAITYEIGR